MKRSLYREYRPQTFDELVGQDHVARTLRNAVETGAVAHAYVFAGPRGTGKTSTARILAKSLNCVGPDGTLDHPTATPCGVCVHCRSIADGTSLDVIEMDAASNRQIDDIRELRETVAYTPVQGRTKVYILDEVHMLTPQAFNAFLKTLEEPPNRVIFVLATTEPHKLPDTIMSRCQRFDFKRPHVGDIARLLRHIVEQENAQPDEERGGPRVEIQDAALLEIARHSQGGFRDAIGTLEKLVTYAEGVIRPADVLDALGVTHADLLFEVTDIVAERQTAEALQFVQRLANEGTDYSQFIRDLLRHLRQLFLLQHLEASAEDETALRALSQTVELDEQQLGRLLPQAHQLHPREIVRFIETLGTAQSEIRGGLDPRLQLELALVKLTRPQLDHTAAALEERLRRLEAAATPAGTHPQTAPAPGRAERRDGASADPGPEPRRSPVDAQPGASAPGTPPADRQSGAPQAEEQSTPAAAEAAAAETAASRSAAEGPTKPDTQAAGKAAPETADIPGAGTSRPADAASGAGRPELTLERVKRAWDLILQHLQGTGPALYALLREARPSALIDDHLEVVVHSGVALARARMPGNAELLAGAVEATLDATVTASFVAGEEPPKPATQQPAKTQTNLDFTELIKQAGEVLDAEPLPDGS